MAEKSKGLWKTDMKTATAVKAIGGAAVLGLLAGDIVKPDIAQGIISILSLLFGGN